MNGRLTFSRITRTHIKVATNGCYVINNLAIDRNNFNFFLVRRCLID